MPVRIKIPPWKVKHSSQKEQEANSCREDDILNKNINTEISDIQNFA